MCSVMYVRLCVCQFTITAMVPRSMSLEALDWRWTAVHCVFMAVQRIAMDLLHQTGGVEILLQAPVPLSVYGCLWWIAAAHRAFARAHKWTNTISLCQFAPLAHCTMNRNVVNQLIHTLVYIYIYIEYVDFVHMDSHPSCQAQTYFWLRSLAF